MFGGSKLVESDRRWKGGELEKFRQREKFWFMKHRKLANIRGIVTTGANFKISYVQCCCCYFDGSSLHTC